MFLSKWYFLFISVSRTTILSHLKTYNLYYEGQNLQLRHREVGLSLVLFLLAVTCNLISIDSEAQRDNNCPLCVFVCVCALITAPLS